MEKGQALINYSYGRFPDGSDNTQILSPTPLTTNQTALHSSLIINEVVAKDINDGNDWFELYNNGNGNISLANYTVIDGSNDIEPVSLPNVVLMPNEYIVIYATDEDKSSLAHKAGYLLCIAENTLEEIELSSCYQLFENNKKVTAIYFKEKLTEIDLFLNKVENIKKPIILYLFSWGEKSEFEVFFDHLDNVKVKTIPKPILDIYKKIYNIVTV